MPTEKLTTPGVQTSGSALLPAHAVAEAVRLAVHREDVCPVGQAVKQCGGKFLVAKHLRPAGELQVRGYQ